MKKVSFNIECYKCHKKVYFNDIGKDSKLYKHFFNKDGERNATIDLCASCRRKMEL